MTEVIWEEVPPGHAAIDDVRRVQRIVRELASEDTRTHVALLRLQEAELLLLDVYGDPGETGERLG